MDSKTIQDIIRLVNKSDLAEVEIEEKDFRLRIKRHNGDSSGLMPGVFIQQTALPPAEGSSSGRPAELPAGAADENESSVSVATITVTAPMIGTFYRSSGPEKEAYVKVGDVVSRGQVLCIIEAMKLFNEIESEVEGKIVKILVENAQPIEYEQPLFVVEPNS